MDQNALNQLEELINKALLAQEKRLEKRFATKDDLRIVATKDDLKDFAAKNDLKSLATKEDLKKFVTKEYLTLALEKNQREIVDEIAPLYTELIIKLDSNKADKSLVAELGSRVVELERKIAS